MKTKFILSIFILLFGFGLNACNRSDSVEAAREPDSLDDRQKMLTEEEKDFVLYASEMHVGEIELAKQAMQKSTNKNVREYADAVIRGHSNALKRLSDRMERSGAPLSKMASLDTQYHAEFLSPLSGAQFDQQFVDLMIADHLNASDVFRAQLNMGGNRNLQDYMEDVLPTLEDLTAQGSRTK